MPFAQGKDIISVLSRRPVGIVTGELGLGKTTMAVAALPDYFYLQTRPTNLRALVQAKEQGALEGVADMRLPSRWATAENHEGNGEGWSTDIRKLASWIPKLAKDGAAGLIVDEYNTLLGWAEQDLKRKFGSSGGATFDRIDSLKGYVLELIGVARAHNFGLILVSHWASPVYHVADEKTGKQGDLKYPGGPAFPIGTQIKAVSRECDFVWKLEAEREEFSAEPPRRQIVTQARNDHEVIKTAGWIDQIVPVSGLFTIRNALTALRFPLD